MRGWSASAPAVSADDEGIRVSPGLVGSYEVLFDGRPVWAFTRLDRRQPALVRWPRAMRPWLDGVSVLSLRPIGRQDADTQETVEVGPVSFGSGTGEVAFLDRRGLPVVVDKWGIVQRPFSTRNPQIPEEMTRRSLEIMAAVREECGIETWMAFGTLLGAARAGGAIGHDSDVDLLFLSEHQSPSMISLEIYRIKRALARRGFPSVIKSGSFVTVVLMGSDGAPIGIDIYACFYVGDLLHETATVRAPIPRSAVLPLRTLKFEGHQLPAPADPDVLLEASYGSGWRVPDPSFHHQPGPEIAERFDGWFGSLMAHRRAWESWWREHPDFRPMSPLARALAADLPSRGRAKIIDVGAGNASDALRLAQSGSRVLALDYARGVMGAARHDGLALNAALLNLYDTRDVFTRAALERRAQHPARWLLARSVLDALRPQGVDGFWRFTSLVMRGGGRAYLEFDEAEHTGRCGSFPGGAPRYSVRLSDVQRRVRASGGTILHAEEVERAEEAREYEVLEGAGDPRRTWRVVARWA